MGSETLGVGALIAALKPSGDGWQTTVPDGWLQGRTAYGGLSSALALHVAQRSDVDLPPLRSAQIAFIGPLSGVITLRAERLRRGRNAAYVQVDISGDAGLGLRAMFVFVATMASSIDHRTGRHTDCPPPMLEEPGSFGIPAVAFTKNFEFIDRPDATTPTAWRRWVRLRDRTALDPAVELLAVADCLPPAALRLIGRPAPVSSMTWLVNLLMPVPRTRDGWWLLNAHTDHASEGYSSQRMAVWNTDLTPVAEQMQGVAIFA
ncbi:thioesterase family protein [Sphingomonas mollis]|uniref:Thioesterase family protein n=1 Tax=Sphingomonas mollis TaxID=2795726 RepID=A0ABS0XMH1_9SPHN|nr:thioesterase family protein [Sphingomonas sp. BT553]MBJ6120933.1 thioesterase family protein [Sphingomonas sp. BT553]